MPRPPKKGFQWVSIQLPSAVYKTLDTAAQGDDRSLNAYLVRVLTGHAALLDTVDPDTRKQIAVLSSLPASQQAAVLQRAQEQFRAATEKGRKP